MPPGSHTKAEFFMHLAKHLRLGTFTLPVALALVSTGCDSPSGAPPPDVAPPAVQILLPAEGQIIQDTVVVIQGTATDNRTVHRVAYQVRDQPRMPVEVVQGPSASFSLTVPIVEDLNAIKVFAIDEAGNEGSAEVRVNGTVPRYRHMSVADVHVCTVSTVGNAFCWGENANGALGANIGPRSALPVRVSGGLQFQSISAGGHFIDNGFTCGVTVEAVAYCWGDVRTGLLGSRGVPPTFTPTPVQGAPRLASITAGAYHACGLTAEGEAICWGANHFGQTGAGMISEFSPPTPVLGGLRFAALEAGFRSTCGITTAGETYCWGEGTDGVLGNGSHAHQTTPVRVSGEHRFVAVAAGKTHVCARTVEGTVYCWGNNHSGQLGIGGTSSTSTSFATPQRVLAETPLSLELVP